MAELLLGEDGRGYELARRLEGCGAWRSWLGDAAYTAFVPALASPDAWVSFLNSSSQLPLQFRVRALLYDKASAALSLPPSAKGGDGGGAAAKPSISDINPAYLQLHGDDFYLSLEDLQDGVHHQVQSRPAFSPRRANEHSYDRAARVGLRYKEPENLNSSQRHRHDELPDAWSNLSVDKQRFGHLKYSYSDMETNKRTPEGMSAYLKLCEVNKRQRRLLTGEHILEKGSCMPLRIDSESNKSVEEESLFLPEMMLPWNCVPESALPATDELVENQKVECFEVLDNLPAVMSMSPAMIERFGITPEYVKMGTKYRGKDGSGGQRISLSQEQARKMIQKVVARVLSSTGFDAGNETPMEVFSEIINSHICKLGRTLKILTDSYRKQFSAVELLRMFLQATGHSNLGELAEIMKSTNRASTHQTQQHVRAVQSQNQNPLVQSQNQNPLVQVPQLQRHIHPQLSMFNPHNLTLQQQQQLLWRRQAAIRGSQMAMEKDKPPSEVKTENTGEPSMDGTLKHQMQVRYPTMTNNQNDSGQLHRQLPSVQIPQSQNTNEGRSFQ